MAVTGLIMVAYLITHVLANLLVFQGPDQINAYSRFLHGTGGALWAARLVLLAAVVLHIVAAVQLTGAAPGRAAGGIRRRARAAGVHLRLAHDPLGRRADPGLPRLPHPALHRWARCTPRSSRATPTTTSPRASRNPLVVVFYELAMAAVGLHLYHGIWSSGRSLGLSAPSPHPLRRQLALVLSVIVWAGFAVIPVAVYAGVIRP